MYNTSTTKTRVTWAAGSYNVAFDTEIGHFQFCNGPYQIPATPFGVDSLGNPTVCPGDNLEGTGVNTQPNDSDDVFCFPGSEALVFKVSGCTFTNTGFDGASYQMLWPDGNTRLHPTPFQFTSPETGTNHNVQYKQVGLEADLPAIESTCNTVTGAGCTLIPQADNGHPASFYPLHHDQNKERLRLAVRQRHPARDQRLRAERPVRHAAPAGLHRQGRQFPDLVQRLPQHHLPQPVPAGVALSSLRASGRS